MAEANTLAEIARLRDAAHKASAKAAQAAAVMVAKKGEVAQLTTRLKDEFGIESWPAAHDRINELAAEAEAATSKARQALVAEGIISE